MLTKFVHLSLLVIFQIGQWNYSCSDAEDITLDRMSSSSWFSIDARSIAQVVTAAEGNAEGRNEEYARMLEGGNAVVFGRFKHFVKVEVQGWENDGVMHLGRCELWMGELHDATRQWRFDMVKPLLDAVGHKIKYILLECVDCQIAVAPAFVCGAPATAPIQESTQMVAMPLWK